MSKGPKELRLEIDKKCGVGGAECICTKGGGIFDAKREDRIPGVTGFVALVHSIKKGQTFRLSNKLDNESLDDAKVIYGVTKVSVYYWVGDASLERPLLLERDNSGHKKYYYKYDKSEPTLRDGDPHIWKLIPDKLTLQERLDDRNCGRNHAVPLNIANIESGTLAPEVKSDCLKKTRRIDFGGSQSLTGSEYVATTYQVNGDDTKISRVKVGNTNMSGITIPPGGMDKVRLYSNTGISKVPIMINFNPNNGESKWYYSKYIDGRNWGEVSDTGFYNGNQPTAQLSEKLDEFSCEYHKGVTINLSYDKFTGDQKGYCCGQHKDGGMVSVSSVQVYCTQHQSQSSLKAYKHSISGDSLKLAGIKFYLHGDNQNRKRVHSTKLNLPIKTPVDVYAMYSDKNNPILIYVDADRSQDSKVTGWYRSDKSNYDMPWKRTGPLKGVKSNDFERISCQKWKVLRDILKKRGRSLPECPPKSTQPLLQRAEEGRGPEYEEADSQNEESEDEISPLGITINIRQNTGTGYTIYPPSGPPDQKVKVTRGKEEDPASSGFWKFTHIKNGSDGVPFKVEKVIFGHNGHKIDISENTEIKSLSVWYWEYDRGMENPLLIEVATNGGPPKYYAKNNNGGHDWSEVHDPLSGEFLEKTLDDLNCRLNRAVTLDLSHNKSEELSQTHAKDGKHGTYCCTYHIGRHKVSVASKTISCTHQNKISIAAYKHSIYHPFQLAKVKYHDDPSIPRRIKLKDHPFPTKGPLTVYVFYCANKPALIYFKDGIPSVNKWFKPTGSSTDEWTHVFPDLKTITPDNFKSCSHKDFNALVGVLSCKDYQPCTGSLGKKLLDVATTTVGYGVAAGLIGLGTISSLLPEPQESSEPPPKKEANTPTNTSAGENGVPGPRGPGESVGGSSTHTSAQHSGASQTEESQPATSDALVGGETAKVTGAEVPVIATLGYALSGSLAGAGATFFGGWKLYNRYKGDPWVRQI